MTILIQPSFGNPVARRHWRDTIEQEVDFAAGPRAATLTTAQQASLLEMHPGGRARFWGATRAQDRKMATAETGDVVLFTGKGHVRGIGELGHVFRNAAFADTLWRPDPTNGSWHNVYSLLSFQPALIPYQALQGPLGSDPGDNFMGLRLIRDDREALVLDALGIRTINQRRAEDARLGSTLGTLLRALGSDDLIPPERAVAQTATYTMSATEVLVRRVEAALVQTYVEQLPTSATVQRIRCSAGLTDLYVCDEGRVADLLEAKSSADHHHVRQALGQILDYAHAVSVPVSSLSILLPSCPSRRDTALLHHYGIDCVYRLPDGSFRREAAATEAHRVWRHESGQWS